MDFSFLVSLYEGMDGGIPAGEDAESYFETIGEPTYPVLADTTGRLLDVTPYDGEALPGKCALSPQMELLECTTGHGNETLFDVIREHAGL